MKMHAIVLVLLAVSGSLAYAQDAKQCISVGSTGDGQTLQNNCSQDVEVIWCHDNGESKHRDSKCGQGGKFFQKHDVLSPGEVKSNYYTLPVTRDAHLFLL